MATTQELYALGSDRSRMAALRFLDHFLPLRSLCSTEHAVPENSDCPRSVFANEWDLLEYVSQHPEEPYGLYWDDLNDSGAQAMLFYTRDGHVIFGLAEVLTEPFKRLKELAAFVGATHSCFGSEQRPPDTSTEFIELCKGTELTN